MTKITNETFLHAMGIQTWKLRKAEQAISACAGMTKSAWEDLASKLKTCTLCDLSATRQNTVFGTGNENAELLVIGEAPGATEDVQGKPFVGRGGMLLTAMISAVGLTREEEVFITNIVKCRPPNNRDPLPYEVECCTPYLCQQIELMKPKLIVAVGRVAAHFLLNTDQSMGNLRGKVHVYEPTNTPLLVTYHPAYLLRSPREKAKAYLDWLQIKAQLTG
jgi:uracil-DNA glycosylase family 4